MLRTRIDASWLRINARPCTGSVLCALRTCTQFWGRGQDKLNFLLSAVRVFPGDTASGAQGEERNLCDHPACGGGYHAGSLLARSASGMSEPNLPHLCPRRRGRHPLSRLPSEIRERHQQRWERGKSATDPPALAPACLARRWGPVDLTLRCRTPTTRPPPSPPECGHWQYATCRCTFTLLMDVAWSRQMRQPRSWWMHLGTSRWTNYNQEIYKKCVSFRNHSNVAIDILIFTFYSDQLVIDVETGIVKGGWSGSKVCVWKRGYLAQSLVSLPNLKKSQKNLLPFSGSL